MPSRFIKLQQFVDYEYDPKLNKPRTDKPIYKELYLPKGIDVIITASGKAGHSILSSGNATFYEVKGSPETIRTRIDKEEADSDNKKA